VIVKRKGVVARRGPKEAWSKRTSRCIRTGSEAWLRSSHSFAAIRCRTSGQMIAKSISIKGAGCKSGGCVRKAVELTSGDLPFVLDSGLGRERSFPTGWQKSAEGVLGTEVPKARTVPARG
jgi:hypothetical protein